MQTSDIHIVAHFFACFFAVAPLCFVVGVFLAVKRAMWACSSD